MLNYIFYPGDRVSVYGFSSTIIEDKGDEITLAYDGFMPITFPSKSRNNIEFIESPSYAMWGYATGDYVEAIIKNKIYEGHIVALYYKTNTATIKTKNNRYYNVPVEDIIDLIVGNRVQTIDEPQDIVKEINLIISKGAV